MEMGQGVGTGAETGQGVGTGAGHGGITCVLLTQFSSSFLKQPENLDLFYKAAVDFLFFLQGESSLL